MDSNTDITFENGIYPQWYQFIAEKADLTLFEYDVPNHRIIVHYVKPIFGIPKVIEHVPESLAAFVEERSMPALMGMYEDMEQGKKETSCEIWYRSDLTKGPHCERVYYRVVKSCEGRPVLAYGMAQDITAQRLAEVQYSRIEEHILTNSNDFISVITLNLTRNSIINGRGNRPSVQYLLQAQTYDECLGRVYQLIADKEERALFERDWNRQAVLEAFRKGKTSHSLTFRCQTDNGVRWIKASSVVRQNALNGDIEVTTYSQDIHTQVLMDKIMKNLTETELECISIIDLVNHKYSYLSLNRAARDVVIHLQDDYDKEIQFTADHFVVPEERAAYLEHVLLAGLLKRLEPGTPFNYDVSLHDNTGKLCRKMLRYSYLEADKSMILMTAQDITETYLRQQRQMEQLQTAMQRERRAIDSKREFLSNISHDMRTPLNGIIGFTGLALSAKTEVQMRSYLQKIKVSGSLLLDLINDTLMLSKLESGKLVPEYEIIDNRTISTRIIVPIREAAKKKHIKLVADRSKSPQALLKADRVNTQKIFLNLLSNAVKFTPEGGQVDIIMEHLDEPMHHCNYRFIVRDTGIGMSPEFLEQMYEPFAQEQVEGAGDQNGTGLGLAIVRQLVNLLNGHIEVKSERGKGTEFTVFLPLPLATPEEAAKAAAKSALHTSEDVWIPTDSFDGKNVLELQSDALKIEAAVSDDESSAPRILVCEDNYLNAEITSTLLRQQGYGVVCAANGKEGLAVFEKSKVGGFKAILMDLRMPVMDGYEAARALRQLERSDAKTIPIIAMSADAFEEDRKKTRAVGMNTHLAKPVEPDLLFQTLHKFIDSTPKT